MRYWKSICAAILIVVALGTVAVLYFTPNTEEKPETQSSPSVLCTRGHFRINGNKIDWYMDCNENGVYEVSEQNCTPENATYVVEGKSVHYRTCGNKEVPSA